MDTNYYAQAVEAINEAIHEIDHPKDVEVPQAQNLLQYALDCLAECADVYGIDTGEKDEE